MSAKVATRNRVAATAPIDNGLIEGYEKSFIAYLMSGGHEACAKFLHLVSRDVFSVPHHRAMLTRSEVSTMNARKSITSRFRTG